MRNPQEFTAALEENNAWAFAGRPLDVSFLYAYWNEKGHLSNLTDLSEYMVARLLAEVSNKEKLDALSPERVRGAEYLAAAVILCRRQKFRVSDASGIAGENLLSPADVLPESWLPKECCAMMDCALFDAASHGAMSFHHRYHTEYLAAAWLTRLMSSNCGMEALEDLLFAKVDGQRVLRPALKPVAAWLITEGKEPWRLRLAEWILESCPEIHLLHGDPAALPLGYRRRILSSLIQRYQGRNRVMLNWDRAALARLANNELADDLSRYLLDGTIAEDLRADLLMVVREGKLHICVPAALAEDIERANQGVYSPGARDHSQEFRSRLLEELINRVEPEADEVLRKLLDEPILNDRKDWIRHLLDGRKYLRADDTAWQAGDIQVFAKQFCSEPRSDYHLFRLVGRLLRDIKNHVEYSESAAGRLSVRIGDPEKNFRGYLYGELSELSLDWFKVVQEREVDLGQRPDLSVERAGLNSLPIEVKLANSWSVDELLAGLENQLVGQYLRPANVRYGICVLGNTKPARRWKLSRAEISFAELVVHIQEHAAALQA